MMQRTALAAMVCALSGTSCFAEDGNVGAGILDVQIGAGTSYGPTRIASGRYQFLAVPIVELNYENKIFFSIDDGARYVVYADDAFKFGPVLELRPFGTDRLLPEHEGAPFSGSWELGAFGTVDVGVGVVEARLRRALNDYQGWSGDLAFDTGARVNDRIDVGFEARLAWAGRDFSKEFFAVTPDQSLAAGLPEFSVGDYWSTGVEASVGIKLTDRITWGVRASADRFLGEADDSPRSKSSWDFAVVSSLTYHFSLDLKG